MISNIISLRRDINGHKRKKTRCKLQSENKFIAAIYKPATHFRELCQSMEYCLLCYMKICVALKGWSFSDTIVVILEKEQFCSIEAFEQTKATRCVRYVVPLGPGHSFAWDILVGHTLRNGRFSLSHYVIFINSNVLLLESTPEVKRIFPRCQVGKGNRNHQKDSAKKSGRKWHGICLTYRRMAPVTSQWQQLVFTLLKLVNPTTLREIWILGKEISGKLEIEAKTSS